MYSGHSIKCLSNLPNFFMISSFQINENAELGKSMQICAPGSWMMHTFTGVWDIIMRENCMCQCYCERDDVPRHCTGARNYSHSGDQNSCPGSIIRPLFIRFINVLVWVSARPTEAPAVRIWVKESEFTLYEAARARQPQHQAASSQQPQPR